LREAFSGRNRFVLRLAIIAALGGFLFGYDTGIISGALLFISKSLGASPFDQQAFVGSLLIGAVVGAILSGVSADALSRRRTKIISGAIYVLGALGSAFSQTAAELIVARFVLGVPSAQRPSSLPCTSRSSRPGASEEASPRSTS
jgi:MFS family permease